MLSSVCSSLLTAAVAGYFVRSLPDLRRFPRPVWPPRQPSSGPLPISVVIIARDEERRIGACLDSARRISRDIIVIDAFSRDRTPDICRTKGARLMQQDWGGYALQKNLGNAAARHDWILSLDADEQITPELEASLRHEFARGPRHDAYEVRFHSFYCGKRVRFGAWNPEYHCRLFDRRKFAWNSDEVHEGLEGPPDGSIGRLGGAVLHFTVEFPEQLLFKTERYSSLFAARARRQGRYASWLNIWFNPAFRFLRDYFLKAGCLDGRAGFVIAREAARYTHLKYRKSQEAAASLTAVAGPIPKAG